MKNIIGVVILSLVTLFSANAQDAKAKEILSKLSDKFKSAQGITANFKIEATDPRGKNILKQDGKFSMKGNKYKIDLKDQEILCDATSVFTHFKKNKEVQIAKYQPNEQTLSPAKLFSGSYENEYTFKYIGTKTVNGKSVEVIELMPKKNQTFKKITLNVSPKNHMIESGTLFDKQGSVYNYSISNVNTSAALENAIFTISDKKLEELEVIDLR